MMFSNANLSLYLHNSWMEIVQSIKLCQKCPLYTILLAKDSKISPVQRITLFRTTIHIISCPW